MKNFNFRIVMLSIIILLSMDSINAQEQKQEYEVGIVAFYNLENLFDTINQPHVRDEEFTPTGTKKWTSEKYISKLHNMATVISQIGNKYVKGGPMLIGVSEVENRGVLEDLISMPELVQSNYKIVHYDSPDRRGIDVALLYRANYFKLESSRRVELHIEDKPDFRTRNQMVVVGELMGERINVIVNHWPSRYGGEKRSRPLRNAAADLCRSLADSILSADSKAKIIMMGDLNDDPVNISLVKHLKAKGDRNKLSVGDFYNPMYKKYKSGNGTTAYHDAWSLFDQLVMNQNLLSNDKSHWTFWKAQIFKPEFMIQKEGRFKGYPKRTFSFDTFINGYSDHFPVYLLLIKKKK